MQGRRPVAPGVLRSQPALPLDQRHARIYGTPAGGPEQRRPASPVGLPAVPPILVDVVSNKGCSDQIGREYVAAWRVCRCTAKLRRKL